ncbi:conserved protein of unknown function [Micropruina glycogenica]|uniref:Phosphotyrosine protein phosphatase I domain-containing protein n=1 Tax=Micropruina glycogenica TaxID=75385 RepID=A0A2N9JCB8_9ACTN|nr:conserved protein of unknown function [Micropruina glycogenica]
MVSDLASLPPRLLFICTANRCRSPLAEQLMRRAFQRLEVDALVASAGLLTGGFATPSVGVRVASNHGLDLTRHLSVQVGARLVEVSDLILTMTREHAREIVALAPDAWARVYPLKQFTELTDSITLPRRANFRDAAVMVGEARRVNSILGNPSYDAVEDPMGRPTQVWEAVLADLSTHIDRVARSFAPLLRRSHQ